MSTPIVHYYDRIDYKAKKILIICTGEEISYKGKRDIPPRDGVGNGSPVWAWVTCKACMAKLTGKVSP